MNVCFKVLMRPGLQLAIISAALDAGHCRIDSTRHISMVTRGANLRPTSIKRTTTARASAASGDDGGRDTRGFRIATSSQVRDDVSDSMDGVMDVGRRSSGVLILLAEICVGGLGSPIGVATVALFALLYASGEFGSPVPFISTAPSASEGGYYRPLDANGELEARPPPSEEEDDDATSSWARLRGGCRVPMTRLTPVTPLPAPLALKRHPHALGRHPQVALFDRKGNGDPSKCPFLGGSNGGGLGDANIATGLLFVATVLLLRFVLLRFFATDPQTAWASAVKLLFPVRQWLAHSLVAPTLVAFRAAAGPLAVV